MNLLTELSMPLYRREYKRLVSGEDCQVVAKAAIKELLERTMESALNEKIARHCKEHGAGSDRRNGSYERDLLVSWGWIKGIRVVRGRVSSIADVVIPKYKRTEAEFDAAVMSSFLLGHSTRKCKRFFTELFGEMGVSHSQVSRIIARLDQRCGAWRNRPILKPYAYLWLDGKNAIIQGALKRPWAVLWAYGATQSGQRELLAFQIHRSEGTVHWESLLIDLLDRGLDPHKLKLIIRDDNSACEQAILSIFGDVAQQACAVHLQRNIGNRVSRINRGELEKQVGEIFKEPTLRAAQSKLSQILHDWQDIEPQACLYLKANVDNSLAFYSMPNHKWRHHLKATNLLERFFREIKRFEKSRQFRFADKRSCERFYYAIAKDYNEKHQRMPYQ